MAKREDKLRIGLIRYPAQQWAIDENFETFRRALCQASNRRVEMLVTCECFLDGYVAVSQQSTRDRLFSEVAQDAQGSKYLSLVANEARERAMSIVFGFTQKIGNRLFNSAGLWDSQGRMVGVYHKVHLQAHDKQFDAGDSIPVFDSPFGKLGIMICADRRWPETARTLRLKGARLILNPSFGMTGELNECLMRARAWENNCFIAFAHPNQSLVTGPEGDVIGRLEGQEGVLVVDLDLSQADHRGVLSNVADRRPELYAVTTDPAVTL